MAWTNPAASPGDGNPLPAAWLDTYVHDNMLETGPAKVTTLGDLLVATGANALKRLGIGSRGQKLQADASGDVAWVGSKTTLGSAAASIDVSSIPTCDLMRVTIFIVGASATQQPGIRFNADAGNNYRWNSSRQFGAQTAFTGPSSSNSDASIDLTADSPASTTLLLFNLLVANVAAAAKLVTGYGSGLTSTPSTIIYFPGGAWGNTANRITQITLISRNGTANFSAGSFVAVEPIL